MMKPVFTLLTIITIVLALSCPAYAASSRKGKKIFNKTCKTCHVRKGEGGKLKPSDKTMAQWKRFIKKDHHKNKPEVWEQLNKKDIKNLQKFLMDYALDADRAETCG